jgi:hypothetical protein
MSCCQSMIILMINNISNKQTKIRDEDKEETWAWCLFVFNNRWICSFLVRSFISHWLSSPILSFRVISQIILLIVRHIQDSLLLCTSFSFHFISFHFITSRSYCSIKYSSSVYRFTIVVDSYVHQYIQHVFILSFSNELIIELASVFLFTNDKQRKTHTNKLLQCISLLWISKKSDKHNHILFVVIQFQILTTRDRF